MGGGISDKRSCLAFQTMLHGMAIEFCNPQDRIPFIPKVAREASYFWVSPTLNGEQLLSIDIKGTYVSTESCTPQYVV